MKASPTGCYPPRLSGSSDAARPKIGTDVVVVQEQRESMPHPLAEAGGRLLEQFVLDVRREVAPDPHHARTQGMRQRPSVSFTIVAMATSPSEGRVNKANARARGRVPGRLARPGPVRGAGGSRGRKQDGTRIGEPGRRMPGWKSLLVFVATGYLALIALMYVDPTRADVFPWKPSAPRRPTQVFPRPRKSCSTRPMARASSSGTSRRAATVRSGSTSTATAVRCAIASTASAN